MGNGASPGPAPAAQARAGNSRLTRSSWRTWPHLKLRRKAPRACPRESGGADAARVIILSPVLARPGSVLADRGGLRVPAGPCWAGVTGRNGIGHQGVVVEDDANPAGWLRGSRPGPGGFLATIPDSAPSCPLANLTPSLGGLARTGSCQERWARACPAESEVTGHFPSGQMYLALFAEVRELAQTVSPTWTPNTGKRSSVPSGRTRGKERQARCRNRQPHQPAAAGRQRRRPMLKTRGRWLVPRAGLGRTAARPSGENRLGAPLSPGVPCPQGMPGRLWRTRSTGEGSRPPAFPQGARAQARGDSARFFRKRRDRMRPEDGRRPAILPLRESAENLKDEVTKMTPRPYTSNRTRSDFCGQEPWRSWRRPATRTAPGEAMGPGAPGDNGRSR